MYHLDDMRLKEIGEVLNLSESRVSRILARAEQRLRDPIRRKSLGRLA
jgi:RNA polymerase sigma factor for flagellar operon FliA